MLEPKDFNAELNMSGESLQKRHALCSGCKAAAEVRNVAWSAVINVVGRPSERYDDGVYISPEEQLPTTNRLAKRGRVLYSRARRAYQVSSIVSESAVRVPFSTHAEKLINTLPCVLTVCIG